MDDDVGLAEQPLRPQRQQVGRPWTGADQEHHSRRDGAPPSSARDELRARLVLAAGEHQVCGTAGQQPLQHPAAQGDVGEAAADLGLERSASAASRPNAGGTIASILRPDQPRQHRRSAGGRHCDRHRLAVDDRRRDEAAQLRPVHHVDRNARRPRRRESASNSDSSASAPTAIAQPASSSASKCAATVTSGSGSPQRVRLPRGDVAGAQHQGAAAVEIKEYWKVPHIRCLRVKFVAAT